MRATLEWRVTDLRAAVARLSLINLQQLDAIVDHRLEDNKMTGDTAERVPNSRHAAEGTKYSGLYKTPEHWPREVRHLSWNATDLLGHDPQKNQLYWDGHALVTEKRFSTFERGLAAVSLLIACIGVAATVAQAVIAWLAYAH